MWSFLEEDNKLFLTIEGLRAIDPSTRKQYREVVDVERGRTAEEILLKFKDAKNGRRCLRNQFNGNSYPDLVVKSNREFIDALNKRLGKETTVITRKRKAREHFIQDSDDLPEKQGCGNQQEVIEKYEGEYKLSIKDLKNPPPCYRLREINSSWLNKLTIDVRYTSLMSTILPVLKIQTEASEESESQEGLTEYWLLGGNHLVEALRSSGQEKQVICHVYSNLTRDEALRIASIHNQKQKVLPLTFQDRVAIARRLREEGDDVEGKLSSSLKKVLGEIEMKEIKDSVSTVVSVARYADENYDLFCQLARTDHSINQKLFKLLQSETMEVRRKSLLTAIEAGLHFACSALIDNKRTAALKRVFIRETGEKNWEEAEQNHPNKAKELLEFKDIRAGKYIPEKLIEFCQEAKENDDAKNIEISIKIKKNGKSLLGNELVEKIVRKYQKKIETEIIQVKNIEYEE